MHSKGIASESSGVFRQVLSVPSFRLFRVNTCRTNRKEKGALVAIINLKAFETVAK
jgi:hypothetical protein